LSEERKLHPRLEKVLLGAMVGALIGFFVKELSLPDLVSYWGSRAPFVWASVLLGALFWQHRISRWLALLVLGGLTLLWNIVAFTPLTLSLADGLTRKDELRKADAIFVLSSGLQPDGDLTSAAMSRLLTGLEVLQEGYAPRLILSELYPPQKSYAEVTKKIMHSLHMTQELLTVGPVDNTNDEAVALGRLFQERGWKTLIVVTTQAHSKRASAVIEQQGIEVISVPATETRYDIDLLQGTDERLYSFGSIMHERIGLWMYKRRGWIKE
jgi:uncharacterized SAM-binding protein YcdF (DUF218 family)